jgi:uncharacterized lipoprotein YddW (UPF0748 family)
VTDRGRRRLLALGSLGALGGSGPPGAAGSWAALAALGPMLAACSTPTPPGPEGTLPPDTAAAPDAERPPPAPREFRAAWVATVANIDWPSRPGLPVAQWQQEMHAMLDRARELGLNALVLQVRPACDALYASPLEPWTEYLTGAQGEAPEGGADPLAMWVQEAHRRGLQLHAWFNPYRARHASAKSPLAPTHLARRRPQLVREYGGQLWCDPGEPEAAEHTLAVVEDVLRRYAIDGVHIDDYFYPYPVTPAAALVAGVPSPGEVPFPDDAPFQRYQSGGGLLARDDWRRDNVNRLVRALQATLRRVRPEALLGISPFGLPRPDLRPEGILGFSQYDKLYADVELWVEQGWFDYLAPQLYWPIDRRAQAFAVLRDYWAGRVGRSLAGPRHHWPGLFTSSVARPEGGARSWRADEILAQVSLLRAATVMEGRPGGHIHFSMIALMQDRDGLATRLRAGPYSQDALVPATPWLPAAPMAPPRLAYRGGRVHLEARGPRPLNWAVWRREAGRWQFAVVPGMQTQLPTLGADRLVVSAVGAGGQESERVALTPE